MVDSMWETGARLGHVLTLSRLGLVAHVGWAEEERNVGSFRDGLPLSFLCSTSTPPHTNGNGEEDEGERASYSDSYYRAN